METSAATKNNSLLYGILILIGIGVLVYLFWDQISALWKKEPGEEKSAYDTCVNKNKSLADGADCVNCVPEGSAQPNYRGIIKNGVCEAKPTLPDGTSCTLKINNAVVSGTVVNGVCKPTMVTTQSSAIKITNPQGARTLTYNGQAFQSPMNANLIPTNTTVAVLQTIDQSGHLYYRTQYGWVDGNDATKLS